MNNEIIQYSSDSGFTNNLPKYYLIELTEDVSTVFNDYKYSKKQRLMVWEQEALDTYWVLNINDAIDRNSAIKLYEFTGKPID